MNPLTNVKNINKLNELEAEYGVSSSASWHQQYKDSAYIFIGGLPYELTEGDVLCVFSQYGEIVNINLVRDKKTGKSKGYCFIAYEDQRSTILAVDNFNGIQLKGRTLRVDHVSEYRKPKDDDDIDEETKKLREEGCAPRTPPSQSEEEEEEELTLPIKKEKDQEKKKKKKAKKEKSHKEKKPSSEGSDSISPKIKEERSEREPRMDWREVGRKDDKITDRDRDGNEKQSRFARKEGGPKGREEVKDRYRNQGSVYFSQRDGEEQGKRVNERRDYIDRNDSAERQWEREREGKRDRERDRLPERHRDGERGGEKVKGKGRESDRDRRDRSDRYRGDYTERSREGERVRDRDRYR